MSKKNLEQNLIQKIGIDKIRLSNLLINDIDISKLISVSKTNQVEIHHTATKISNCIRYMPDSFEGITKIVIKDNNVFSDLIIGCAFDSHDKPIEYVYLTVTVTNARGCNLTNMSYGEYDTYISNVVDYIKSTYGIMLFTNQIKVDYIEINTNILLKNSFSEYNRTFRLLMSFFSGHMGKLSIYDKISSNKRISEESFKRGNKSIDIIFYDKIKELKDMKIPISEELSLCRIEVRLKTKDKIKSVFGSNIWHELNDKKIAEYFMEQIYYYLSEKFEKWEQTREKELKKMILNCRKKSSKVWHHLLMQEIRNKSELQMTPYILDIEQIYSAFRKLPDPNRNASRAIKSIENISVENDIYKNNDIAKIYELLNDVKNSSNITL